MPHLDQREWGPVGLNQRSIDPMRFGNEAHLRLFLSEGVMRGEPHGGRRAQMDERVAVTRAGIFPVALVEDVVGIEAKRDAAAFTAVRVADAQIEQVVSA